MSTLALVLSACGDSSNTTDKAAEISIPEQGNTTASALNPATDEGQASAQLPPDSTLLTTPRSGIPLAQATMNLNVRSGPGTDYPIVGILPAGETAEIIGQCGEPPWWQIRFPHTAGSVGWVTSIYTLTNGNVLDIPNVNAPPTLPPPSIATPTETTTPEPTTTAILPSPDLIILGAQPSPTSLLIERPAQLIVTVQNIGNNEANTSLLEGAILPFGNSTSVRVPTITSQDTVSVTLSLTASKIPGSYTVVLTIDPDNAVAEQDEMNNSYTLEVTFYRVILHASGTATVPGSRCFDLDGSERTTCDSKADFAWEQFTTTRRYLVLRNGAQAAVVGASAPTYEGCVAQTYTYGRIDGSNDENNQIPTGTYLCIVTNEGHFASVLIEQYDYNLTIIYTTWALSDS